MPGAATGLTRIPFRVVMHGHGLREADNRALGCRVRDRRMATEQAATEGMLVIDPPPATMAAFLSGILRSIPDSLRFIVQDHGIMLRDCRWNRELMHEPGPYFVSCRGFEADQVVIYGLPLNEQKVPAWRLDTPQ
jgi:hypothetical protein